MSSITADLMRSTVSSVMNVLLLFSLAQPKFNKRITNRIMFGIIMVIVLPSVSFYLSRDLTKLAKYNVIWFLLLYIALKPLFLDNLMQWLFNLITVINVYAIIVVLSYHLCYYLPYPPYAVTFLRFLFFLAVILLFRLWLRSLYRQAVTHWKVYILLVVGIFVNLVYYFMTSENIEATLTNEFEPMLLLIILAIAAYVCIFYSLKTTSNEYALREENIKSQLREELLHSELSASEDYIDISRQHRHDLRHHNALLREMLSRGDTEAALAYLNEYDNSIVETALQQYCSNPVANAIFRLYEHRAQASGIDFAYNTNIPELLPMTAPEFGGLLSNLLENAWVSCKACEESVRFIAVSADTIGEQLFLEVKNSVCNTVKFVDSLPVSDRQGGGTGVKSIMRTVREHSGMCRFKHNGNEFIVQIVLSL